MVVKFLVLDVYGMGGTIRTVLNVANYLAENGKKVEIISVLKSKKESFFEIHPNVKVKVLHNKVKTSDKKGLKMKVKDALINSESKVIHADDEARHLFSLYTDVKIIKFLRSINNCILVTTRPSFNILASKYVKNDSVTVIGQEHLNFDIYPDRLKKDISKNYVNLDYLATLTDDDTKEYQEIFSESNVNVIKLTNSIPKFEGSVSDLSQKTVISVGRLVEQKGFDLLIEAFKIVSEKHPDWKLKIFGSGREKNSLKKMIYDNHLYNNVFLMGPSKDVESELSKSSIYALSSRFEGFGMVLVEAMQCGVPVVAFDCPKGPSEIIQNNVDGIVVENGSIEALANGIIELIEDDEKRVRYANNAIKNVKRYEIENIGKLWLDLISKIEKVN